MELFRIRSHRGGSSLCGIKGAVLKSVPPHIIITITKLLFAGKDLRVLLETVLCLGKERGLICALAEFYDVVLFINKRG